MELSCDHTSERNVWKYPFTANLEAEYTAWPGAGAFPAALLICILWNHISFYFCFSFYWSFILKTTKENVTPLIECNIINLQFYNPILPHKSNPVQIQSHQLWDLVIKTRKIFLRFTQKQMLKIRQPSVLRVWWNRGIIPHFHIY